MKRMLRAASAIGLGVIATASIGQAQNAGGKAAGKAGGIFGIQAGFAMPTSDFGDLAKSGFVVDGMFGFNPAMLPMGLRADVTFASFGVDKDVSTLDGGFRSIGGGLNAIIKVPSSSFSPYLLAGPAIYKNSVTGDLGDANKAAGGKNSSTDFALNLGGGLQFNLSGMQSMLEVKYVVGFGDDPKLRYIPITFGIAFGGGGGASRK